jgi:tetratricopeptide (TPR) repeat protein
MANISDGGGFGRGAVMLVVAGVSFLAAPVGLGHRSVEVPHLPLAEAEERLAVGQAAEAVESYRKAFAAASDLAAKLTLGGHWARALLINQELDGWLKDVRIELEDGTNGGWETHLVRAVVFQFLGDLAAAQEAVASALEGGAPPELGDSLWGQRMAWAKEFGDEELEVSLHRNHAIEVGGKVDHRGYIEALLRTGPLAELEEYLARHPSQPGAEIEFWRSLLPELKQTGGLDGLSDHLEEAWGGDTRDPLALFALAELRLFQGRTEEAAGLFWTIFELEEEGKEEDRSYFHRMNSFLHNRFPVKYRLDQALRLYGSQATRDFALFGFRSDVEVRGTATARDLSLQYLRELLLPVQPTGLFLSQVGEALDRSGASPGTRILAFAGLGAPPALLEEIKAFVESEEIDSTTAEFSLQAMNRYVLSATKFPEIVQPLADLTVAMGGKFGKGRSAGARAASEALGQRILLRLGEPQKQVEAEGPMEAYFARIGAAAEAGKPAEAERLWRELVEVVPGENFGNVLLFIANLWQTEGNQAQAAALVAESLEPILGRRAGTGLGTPLTWDRGHHFPPATSYLGEVELEALQSAFQVVTGHDSKARLKESLRSRYLPGQEEQAALPLVLATILWWSGDREEAIRWMGEVADGGAEPEVQVLLGYMLGLAERFAAGREVLESISSESVEAWKGSRRLLFAFAVAERDAERAAGSARELESWIDLPSERLVVAAGLLSVGLEKVAGGWLEGVVAAALGERDVDLYQGLRLQVMLATGAKEEAVAQSRLILLGNAIDSITFPANALRGAALAALEEAGERENYRNYLRTLANLAPQSLQLSLWLGEEADFETERGASSGARPSRRDEALHFYRKAVGLRPHDLDLRLDFSEWLGGRGFYREAVVVYQSLLQDHVQEVLIDFSRVLAVFARAGELLWLVEFFEEWEMPEARTMDDFYGLQPTEHLMRPIGEALLAQGDRALAARAWENGLRLNPIGFTEQIRLALAKLYREDGKMEPLLEGLRGYVNEPNADPHLYAIQPFSSVVPRWIAMANATRDLEQAPVNQLMAVVLEAGLKRELRNQVADWTRSMPDNVSVAAFALYLSVLEDAADWRERASLVRERLVRHGAPVQVVWDQVEAFLGSIMDREGKGQLLR